MTEAQGGNVCVTGGDGDDGFSGGNDAEHFTGDDNAFEASLNGDDVSVGSVEDRGNFGAGKEWYEPDVSGASCQIFQTEALGTVTDKNKSDIFVLELARGSNDGVPRTVKTQITGVEKDEAKISADGAGDFGI